MAIIEFHQPDGEIHTYFELTYANYLVIPRTLLQSMPLEWQSVFVGLLQQLDAYFRHVEKPPVYAVSCRGYDGKYIRHTVPHYERGRTRLKPDIDDALHCRRGVFGQFTFCGYLVHEEMRILGEDDFVADRDEAGKCWTCAIEVSK